MKKRNEDLKWLGLIQVVCILVVFFIYSLIRYDENVIDGYIKILTSTSVLITDYLVIGGLSATLLNTIVILLFNLFLFKVYKVKVRGVTVAAFFIVLGFSFFGKNILNILPIYLGTYVFSRMEGEKFSKYLVLSMFATGISPIVSFGFGESIFLTVLGPCLGFIYGFIIPTFSAHVIRFHNGYSLYNIGFAGGVYAILVYALLNTFGIETKINNLNSTEFSFELRLILLSISLLYIVLGFVEKNDSKSYKKLLSMSGRAVTDFTMIFGKIITYRNIGFLGLITVFVIFVTDIPTTGIVFGAACTVIGFGAFGKHPRNVLPVMIGALVTGIAVNGEVTNSVLVIALFSTTLAPIAGDFGFVAGLVAGVLHYSIASVTVGWQGGLNLYNNGFASGFVAAIMGSVLDTIDFKNIFKREKVNESL